MNTSIGRFIPDATFDETLGYEVDDVIWIGNTFWKCTDNSEGAAVWVNSDTPQHNPEGEMAQINLKKTNTPFTPQVGKIGLYPDINGVLCSVDENGIVTVLNGGGGGGGIFIRRSFFAPPFTSYRGFAPKNSLEIDAVWTILLITPFWN